ncbi:uncharacterized protein LOC133203476 [Saccostrea echinata]|uniref:uncharacterized protein LOC133203476 n=1 Tax=Saccostrea echinata TaxID=191078 RepID=UPI002A840B3F|nr:uncharacterized protein LOC133203476 [Saccostrea echinata]
MKTQWKSEIIQKMKDVKNGEKEMKSSDEDIREKIMKQAQNFMDQFGKFTTDHVRYKKSSNDSLQSAQSDNKICTKKVFERSVKIRELKKKKENLFHVSCLDVKSAYISGDGPGILFIDRKNFIDTEFGPGGLCCTRSGDILACMGFRKIARVVKYSSSGEKIREFQKDQNGERLFIHPRFICENANSDLCISDCGRNSKVVVLSKCGILRFKYDGKVGTKTLKEDIKPCGVATD